MSCTGECVVVIIDTGLTESASPGVGAVAGAGALAAAPLTPGGFNVLVRGANEDDDTQDSNGDDYLDPYSGHGLFIAGIVNEIAPGAKIVGQRGLRTFGDIDDFELARAIEIALVRLGRLPKLPKAPGCTQPEIEQDLASFSDIPLVINLSVSGYCEDDDPPNATRSVLERLVGDQSNGLSCLPYQHEERRDVVVVASAGNSRSCRITWPAGFDHVVSVGALAGSQPAWFTNYGPWVSACAQGSDLVSRFWENDSGAPPAYSDLDDFPGWAYWSGTSFAAPVVAASIAQDVIASGGEPRDAVERLIERPDLMRLGGLGTVVNVL
jgi:hypothetical protein